MLDRILLALGVILVAYYLVSTLLMGPVSFSAILLGIGILLIAASLLDRKFGALGWVIRLKKVAVPVFVCALIAFAVLEGIVISGAARKDAQKVDYIVVLGAGLREDQLSSTLLRRMETALEIGQGETFVVTGGQGWDETIPEGIAMGRWLMEQGTPSGQILIEDRSTNTHENLEFSKALIEADAGRPISEVRVKIVTSDFHSYRAQMLAKRQGYDQVSGYGAPTPWVLVPSFYIREALALAKSFLFDR